jgi:phage-related protein
MVEAHDGNAYRAVYTVWFDEADYVPHAFQKKSCPADGRQRVTSTASPND